jgi:hypothetical protein
MSWPKETSFRQLEQLSGLRQAIDYAWRAFSLSDFLGAEVQGRWLTCPSSDILGVSATASISAECRGAGNAQFEDEGSETRPTDPCGDALTHYFARADS